MIEACISLALTERRLGWNTVLDHSYACLESIIGPASVSRATDSSFAERYGMGPNAIVRRLVILALLQHKQLHSCPRDGAVVEVSVDCVIGLRQGSCPSCPRKCDISQDEIMSTPSRDYWAHLWNGLHQYTGCVNYVQTQ